MPTYEYRCSNGHTFEVVQSMTDDPISSCTICTEPVQRVFHPVAVHFKGSGFYTTDYGRYRSSSSESSGGDSSESASGNAKSDSKSDSGESAKKAGTKADAAKSD